MGDGEAEADGKAAWLHRYRSTLTKLGIVVVAIMVFVAVEYLMIQTVGIIAAVVYTMAFAIGLGLFATTTAMLGGVTPTFMGRIYFVLGQFAFDRPWLVQRGTSWEMHPGRQTERGEEVWIDGDWHPVPDAEHQTVLHKRPFGILLWKDDDTLQHARVDDVARQSSDVGLDSVTTDGGDETAEITRAGVPQATSPHDVNLRPGEWLIDMKRYWTAGLENIADIDIIEKVEQITMREQAGDSGPSKSMTMWASMGALVLGAATGYLVMFGF